MQKFWFTNYIKGNAIYSEYNSSLDEKSSIHGLFEISDTITFFSTFSNFPSSKNFKLIQFLNTMKNNPNTWFKYDIDKINSSSFWEKV